VTPRPIVLRATAARDVDGSIDFYLSEGGVQVALGFIEALQQAFELLGEQPGAGSQRYAHELGIPGLRAWPLHRYPHWVFYVERADHIDVWRVLHGQRDIPAWLQAPDEA
jgi:toxin ParE1/3/4